jgi:hypothetical protein
MSTASEGQASKRSAEAERVLHPTVQSVLGVLVPVMRVAGWLIFLQRDGSERESRRKERHESNPGIGRSTTPPLGLPTVSAGTISKTKCRFPAGQTSNRCIIGIRFEFRSSGIEGRCQVWARHAPTAEAVRMSTGLGQGSCVKPVGFHLPTVL